MPAAERRPPAQRDAFKRFLPIAPRWNELDALGHVNNAEIYGYFDTAIVQFLFEAGAFDVGDGAFIPMLAESGARFHSEVKFEDALSVGMAIETIGNSSVRYRVGLFRGEGAEAAADGFFVHVFVDRKTRRPTPIESRLRDAMEKLQ
ncbi:MAG TPA: thioesterase family protein [Devosia sp.]|nr:thioesterase family protein [Devosia sp.]